MRAGELQGANRRFCLQEAGPVQLISAVVFMKVEAVDVGVVDCCSPTFL